MKLIEYVELFSESIESFKAGIDEYVKSGSTPEFDEYVEKTHNIESIMDDLRREISYDLYSRTLLPDSRGDILFLFGVAEKIPDSMEYILFSIQCESIVIPEELTSELKHLIEYTYEALVLTALSFSSLFKKKSDIPVFAVRVGELESKCDKITRSLLKKLFEMPVDCGEKVLFKTFIESLEHISDRAEAFTDALVISSVKGQI